MISTAIPYAQIRHIPQRETEQHVQSRKAVEHKNYETNSSYHCSLWFEILNLVGPKYTDYHHSPTTTNGSILFLFHLLVTKNLPPTILRENISEKKTLLLIHDKNCPPMIFRKYTTVTELGN